MHPDVEEIDKFEFSEDEERVKRIKENYNLTKIMYIAGYIEWHEENKIPIPGFCPLHYID